MASLARLIDKFPAAGLAIIKDRVNAVALAPVEISSAKVRAAPKPKCDSRPH